MRGKPRQRRSHRRRDTLVARIASAQHGVITRAQLRGCGVGDGAIDAWVRHSRLHPIHRGVYLLGHRAATQRALELAAVLACGDGAVLSHRSAAQLWKLLPYPAKPGRHDVTLRGRRIASRAAILVHRGDGLKRHEWQTRDGVPVTKPARTLLDLAGHSPTVELEQAVDEAHVRRLVGRAQLLSVVNAHPHRPGVRALAEVAGLDGVTRITHPGAERRFLSLLRAARLPLPESNASLHGHQVDFLWRHHGLIVETDGWATHSSRPSFERDRRRDAELAARGFTTIRITWRQLTRAPEATIATVAAALAVRAQVKTNG